MAVSVIVSNMNGMAYLPRLLETLRTQKSTKIQIIVVDRQSVDNSFQYLASDKNLIVIQEPPETGLVSGYAAGVSYACHDHLFFCNEDMWFNPDCLRLLEEKINYSAGMVAADPWQWTYDGMNLIHAGTRFAPAIWNFLCPYPFRRYLFSEIVQSGDLVPFPCAGAFMIHRKAYDDAGGWDKSFFLDHEDVDLFIRIWQLGYKCVSVPEAHVFHAVGASNLQTIPATNTPVRRRRFISGQASVAIIGIKYFTGWMKIYSFLFPFMCVMKEIVRLRLRFIWLNILVALEFFQRIGPANRFRNEWLRNKKVRSGQLFFVDPHFNISIKHKIRSH